MALVMGDVAMSCRSGAGPWVWGMLYQDQVIDLVKVPPANALYAVCNECPKVMAPAHWPVRNSVAMHREGTGHRRLHYVAPQPHKHSDWCAPICGGEPLEEGEG